MTGRTEIWEELPPPIQQIGPRHYRLYEDQEFHVCGFRFIILKDFMYDGASIPKLLWGLVGSPFTGCYTTGALVHDLCYKTKVLPKSQSDIIFRVLMDRKEVPEFKKEVIYNSVRCFGHRAYNKPAEQKDKVILC